VDDLMPTLVQLFDIESAIEDAVKTLLESVQLTAVTRRTASEAFQQKRPRVELMLVLGQEMEHFQFIEAQKVNDLWVANLRMAVVTDADAKKQTHSEYRAQVRLQFAKLRHRLFGAELLPYHAITRCVCTGTTPSITPEDGTETSTLDFELHVNIRTNVWPDAI
jgi:hypothetical protein